MDLRLCNKFHLLVLASLLCLHVRAQDSGSIFFLDSPGHRFLRTPSSDVVAAESNSVSLPDVGAAVSVLLGFAPPASLSADSSSKLNEILLPNPFHRPNAVLVLEVKGTEDPHVLADYLGNARIGATFRSKVVLGSIKADIHLPDENEVSLASLDEPLSSDCNAACVEKELHDLASWLGGSCATCDMELLNGELTIPLASGASLNLDMSKKADREFIMSLLSLIHNIRRAMELHEDFAGSIQHSAELMTGCFTGIKALQEQYGAEGIAQLGMELFLTTLTKLFDSLQAAYKGQIVGVIFFNGKPSLESETLLNMKFTSSPSSRWLEEILTPPDVTAIVEVLLVRRVLAWITGIILLISTLLGIYFLFSMPLTRDTLLYSNVKLD